MDSSQVVFCLLLVITLLAMAGFFAWRQVRTLRELPTLDEVPDADRQYFRNLAWRRLICSALMVVLAGLLAGSLFLEGDANRLVRQGQENRERGEPRQMNAEEEHIFQVYKTYWIITLLVLLAIIILAAFDYFAIRRYGVRHYRQIQADRRTMIEHELTRLRSQRNGHH